MPLPRLVPQPTHLSPLPGTFTFGPATTLKVAPGAEDAARLLRTLLRPATGLPLHAAPDGSVVLAVDPALTGLGAEGYGLTVGPEGVLLRAARPQGLLAGVQTLRQLLPVDALGDAPVTGVDWSVPCVQVTDVPRFPWRGSMLDVARHFRPASYLRRYVDLLALHKLNVLHLHLTDDQGWRMPVAARPRLTEIGGAPRGGAYTRAELTGLVAYAAERGVTVVPEIEMPGHVRAALAAYPELGNHPGRTHDVWDRWGVCDTVLGVHDTALAFCRDVLDEVMDVFPSPYVHVGGDECPTTEWHTAPTALRRIADEGLDGPGSLHRWFTERIGDHLLAAGRQPLGWTENGADLPPYFTVMPWRDADHGRTAVRRGHQVVMTPHRSTYLDYPQSEDPAEPPGQAGGIVDLRTVHGNDPAPAHWSPEETARVLGSQAQLWTEYVPTAAHAEYLTFPRLCALAEAVWTGRHDWPGFLQRLRHHRTRLDALGVPRRLSTPSPSLPTRGKESP
ncbi:beta-N-acetylhexosaminidase [Streptomyces sp. NPDC003327]